MPNEIHHSEGLEFLVNNPLATLTDQFLKERTYFKNVTPATLAWYQVAFKNYQASFPNDTAPVPTKAALHDFVVVQRNRGIRLSIGKTSRQTIVQRSQFAERGDRSITRAIGYVGGRRSVLEMPSNASAGRLPRPSDGRMPSATRRD